MNELLWPYGGRTEQAFEGDFASLPMRIQFGPSHPATHGTVRIVLDLGGEKVIDADVQVGYLHRGFEKECERVTIIRAFFIRIVLTIVSPIFNNVGYCLAVEKLLALETPPRCHYVCLSRIADHMLAVGALALELGAYTPFLYLLEGRELVWDPLDALCGSRVTADYIRIGGVLSDLPEDFTEFCIAKLDEAMKLVEDTERLFNDNPIFRRRMEGTGMLPADQLVMTGVTVCLLRAACVPLDLGRAEPYLVYGDLDFDVPVGENGDNLDRYVVRVEEIRQSRRMVLQSLRSIPAGPVNADEP